jgi:plasmid stabilization system protein ParE
MAFLIEWTDKAIQDFEQIITYLEQNHSDETAADFAIKVSQILDLLSQMPLMYPLVSPQRNVRKCVITKQNLMFYRVLEQKVTILNFFDTRQNPDIGRF